MPAKKPQLCQCKCSRCLESGPDGRRVSYRERKAHVREQELRDIHASIEQEKAEGASLREKEEGERRKAEEQRRRQDAAERALAAVESQRVDEANLLSQLYPSGLQGTIRPAMPESRRDRERLKVDIFSQIVNGLDELRTDLDFLNQPDPSMNLAQLQAGVAKLEALTQNLNSWKRRVQNVQHVGPFPSAQALRDEANAKAKLCTVGLEDALRKWSSAIHARQRLRTNQNAATYDTSHLFTPILQHALPPVQVIMFMVVVCSTILSLSRRGCSWLFGMCQAALIEAFIMTSSQSPSTQKIADTFPRDLPTATKHFNVDTKATVYAVCPECHHITAPLPGEHPFPMYQERCNYQRYGRGRKCKALLVRQSTTGNVARQVPIKPFVSFDFRDWLARLLAREGNEEKMDQKWKDLKQDPTTMTEEELEAEFGDELRDVFDGSFVRSFKGPDGKHFKDSDTPGEGRYLFSLSFDSFNPLTNKMAGKKLSVGAFSLVCLNLPVEERYKPENMFLAGIIPGPKEPPLDAINSFWIPLVDCFEELWHHGIYFNRTFMHQEGRLVRCAIIMLVCDLPAARKIGGMASCRHQWFCSRCLCSRDVKRGRRRKNRKSRTKKDAEDRADEDEREREDAILEQERASVGSGAEDEARGDSEEPPFEGGDGGNRVGYENFDMKSWKMRTGEECRLWANRYRTAETAKLAQILFDKTGLRWTEFHRLPYFNLPIMLVVDSMHNMFLGLLKEHFRHILGLRSIKKTKVDSVLVPVFDIDISPSASNPLPTKDTELKSLKKALRQLSQPMSDDLKDPVKRVEISQHRCWTGLHVPSALYIAKGVGCTNLYRTESQPIQKKEIIEKILNWRMLQSEILPETAPDATVTVEPFTQEEKEALWSDLANIVQPSWVTSVPPQIGGESSDGKLKSDQWRTLGTMYMPLTLIRLWAESEDPQRREILDLTMDLVSAVILASSRITSRQNSEACLNYLLSYRAKLRTLFPKYRCHPNHHMSLHIPEFLLLYGPVHGWWTFPSERVIGKLQRIRTNYKPGEYEATIGHKYHQASNLKLMSGSELFPASLKQLTNLLDKLLRPETRNVFLDDERDDVRPLRPSQARQLTPEVFSAFEKVAQSMRGENPAPFMAHSPSSITIQGVRYTTNSKHRGNSCVIVKGAAGEDIPMVIQHIIQDADDPTRVFFAVKQVKSVAISSDPFENYPVFGAKIWARCNNLHSELDVIHFSELSCHFASCDIEATSTTGEISPAAVVIPLRKSILVSYEESSEDNDTNI